MIENWTNIKLMKLTSHDWTHVRTPDVCHRQVAVIRCPKICFEVTVQYWPSQEHLIGRLFNALVAAGRKGV
jgi:hypothetical protein